MAIKICLDAGHYGKYNQSPAVKTYYEAEMTWKLHNLLKKYLEEYGVKVIQTRSKQAVDMGLKARGQASKGCNLFISIHSNAVGNKADESVDYPLVIVPINGSGTKIGEKLAKCIESTMGTKQKAKTISKKGSGDWDYYSVIYGATSVDVPGIILEHSFHTNTKMAKWLLDEKNLDKLAKAEAEVIASHYGLKKATPKTETAKKTVYRVQTGAYSKKADADNHLKKVKKAGFDGWMEKVDGKYTIFAGSFEVKKNAENRLAEVKKAGFSGKIVEVGSTKKTEPAKKTETKPAKKTVAQLAKEVINGDWGNGTERKKRLTEAGYDYSAVQKEVNRLCK